LFATSHITTGMRTGAHALLTRLALTLLTRLVPHLMLSSSCEFDMHIFMLSSSCELDMHIAMLSSSCELYMHIFMLSSSCCLHRHIVMLSSSWEIDRHIVMLSSWYHHLVTRSLWSPNEDFVGMIRFETQAMWETTSPRLIHAGLGKPINEDNMHVDVSVELTLWCCHDGVPTALKSVHASVKRACMLAVLKERACQPW